MILDVSSSPSSASSGPLSVADWMAALRHVVAAVEQAAQGDSQHHLEKLEKNTALLDALTDALGRFSDADKELLAPHLVAVLSRLAMAEATLQRVQAAAGTSVKKLQVSAAALSAYKRF